MSQATVGFREGVVSSTRGDTREENTERPQLFMNVVVIRAIRGIYLTRGDLMMELEGGHRNSLIKRGNPIKFGLN
ncbi:hypothetical protein EVAR_51379_1 [Eumeta japonica]|uniref:Uncharacterized protein n=1 Tax=Eumeta variegata TaxID=151549 RepID=A0A4C1Y301_EUMVA|nr:hypothetical protein EVAR_51379_1 [Eumeta japonica]